MPTTAPEPATQIALGIIERNGQFLLSQRAPQAHQGNLWEFPGGKIEPGETPQQALTRELAEELGIRLIYARPLLSFPWPYPNHPLHLHVLQVTQFTGHPTPRESQPLRWTTPQELPTLPMPPANTKIIHHLLERTKQTEQAEKCGDKRG